MTAVDPAVQLIVRAALSMLFAWAALHKIRDAPAFRTALATYALLPGNWTVPAATLLTAAEATVVAALWIPGLDRAGAGGAAALLLLYAGAISLNLLRGRREIDCGCAGAARRQPLSAWLVARNVAIAAAALAATLPAATRPLKWVDAVTIVAGVAASVLLHAAAEALLATAPRIARLRPMRQVLPHA